MKRLFLSLALAGSLSALAAPEKVLTVRVADTAEIISAVSRVGEFIGNPMLVLPLSAGITANPAAKVLGPARAGATTTVCVYADPELTDFEGLAFTYLSGDLSDPVSRQALVDTAAEMAKL